MRKGGRTGNRPDAGACAAAEGAIGRAQNEAPDRTAPQAGLCDQDMS